MTLAQLGLSLTHLGNCKSLGCLMQLERASLEMLKIDWRPTSVFPEENRRFR